MDHETVLLFILASLVSIFLGFVLILIFVSLFDSLR